MNLKWNTNMLNSFYSVIKIDESFKKIFEQFGLPLNRTIEQGFESLAKIIIGQQISTNVAKSLSDKLKKSSKNCFRFNFTCKKEWTKFSYNRHCRKISC